MDNSLNNKNFNKKNIKNNSNKENKLFKHIKNNWKNEYCDDDITKIYNIINNKIINNTNQIIYISIKELYCLKLNYVIDSENSFILFKFQITESFDKELYYFYYFRGSVLIRDSENKISCCIPYNEIYPIEIYQNSLFISFNYKLVSWSNVTFSQSKYNKNGLLRYIELITYEPIYSINYDEIYKSIPSYTVTEYINKNKCRCNINGFIHHISHFINEKNEKYIIITICILIYLRFKTTRIYLYYY